MMSNAKKRPSVAYFPLLDTDHNLTRLKVDDPENGLLEALQKAVGGYIEVVRPRYAPDFLFVINEEGKIHHMEFNLEASILYGNPIDCLVGNVVVARLNDAGDDLTGWDENDCGSVMRELCYLLKSAG